MLTAFNYLVFTLILQDYLSLNYPVFTYLKAKACGDSMDEYVIVLTTVPSRDVGLRIAREAVGRRLAACINIVPAVHSIYLWKGKVEEAKEELLIIKTRRDLVNNLYSLIKSIHPYEIPEFIYLDIKGGSKEYLNWLVGELKE